MGSPSETISAKASQIVKRTRILVFILVLGTIYLLANLLHFAFGRDQGIFAVVADTFFRNGVPYKDAWDFKTPGIYFIYALARLGFGTSEIGFRLFEALSWLMMGAGVLRLSMPLIDWRAALLGFSITVFGLMETGFWNVGQPESFSALFVIWAIALSQNRQEGTLQWLSWATIAVLYSFAGYLKPPLGGGILVTFAWIAFAEFRKNGRRGIWRPFTAFITGGSLSLLSLYAWLVLSGAWPAFYDALFLFAPNYTALGHNTQSLITLFGLGLYKFALVWPLITLGTGLFFVLSWKNRTLRSIGFHIFGVIMMSFLGIALQAKFFYYHYGLIIALGGILSGWGYWLLWQRIAQYKFAAPLFLIGLFALTISPKEGRQFWKNNAYRAIALAQPQKRDEIAEKLYKVHTMDTHAIRQTAAWLAQNKPLSGDPSLFIWGFEPLIYTYSGLRPHNRFIYNAPMRAEWSKNAAFTEFWKIYDDQKPWAIIVQSNDRLPRVNGDPRDSKTVLQEDLPRLQSILNADYHAQVEFGPFSIYILGGG